jgi:hypothetical protein
MSGLTIVGIVGYLLVGCLIGRILYRLGYLKPKDQYFESDQIMLVMIIFMWAIAAPFALIGLAGWGLYKVVTMPTRPERIRARIERSQRRIADLERELGIR